MKVIIKNIGLVLFFFTLTTAAGYSQGNSEGLSESNQRMACCVLKRYAIELIVAHQFYLQNRLNLSRNA